MRDRPYEEVMVENFREDPDYAIHLLNNILEDGDQEEFMAFLPMIAAAFDETTPPAPAADAPVVDIVSTLRRIGFRLAVVPLTPAPAAPEPEKHAEHPEPVMA